MIVKIPRDTPYLERNAAFLLLWNEAKAAAGDGETVRNLGGHRIDVSDALAAKLNYGEQIGQSPQPAPRAGAVSDPVVTTETVTRTPRKAAAKRAPAKKSAKKASAAKKAAPRKSTR